MELLLLLERKKFWRLDFHPFLVGLLFPSLVLCPYPRPPSQAFNEFSARTVRLLLDFRSKARAHVERIFRSLFSSRTAGVVGSTELLEGRLMVFVQFHN